jgi:dTDP-4-dehydrorhamnose 3,5-epimerase
LIDGVKILKPDVFKDFRGDLWTTWKKDEFPYDVEFNHDKVSTSKKNVLRGIHSWRF